MKAIGRDHRTEGRVGCRRAMTGNAFMGGIGRVSGAVLSTTTAGIATETATITITTVMVTMTTNADGTKDSATGAPHVALYGRSVSRKAQDIGTGLAPF